MVPQFRLDSICVRWGSFVDPSLSPLPVCSSSSASIHWTRNKTRMAIWDSFSFLSRFSTIALTMHRLMSGDSGPSDNVVDMKRLFKLLHLVHWCPAGNETKANGWHQRESCVGVDQFGVVDCGDLEWGLGYHMTWSRILSHFVGLGVGVEMESRVGGWGGGFR